mgnify:CR=1 FL=1
MEYNELEKRLIEFTDLVIGFMLDENIGSGDQMVSSASSALTIYQSTRNIENRSELRNKLETVIDDLYETAFHLEVIKYSGSAQNESEALFLLKVCMELIFNIDEVIEINAENP